MIDGCNRNGVQEMEVQYIEGNKVLNVEMKKNVWLEIIG